MTPKSKHHRRRHTSLSRQTLSFIHWQGESSKNLDRFYVALPVPGANPPCDAVWFRVALPVNHTWMSWTVYYDSFFGITRSLSAPRPYRQDLEFLKRQNPEWLISSLFSRAHYLSPIRDGISCIPTEPLFQRSASVSFHLPNYISKD